MFGKGIPWVETQDQAFAMDYITCVSQTFRHEPAKYKNFIKALKALRATYPCEIRLARGFARVLEIIKGHGNLVLGFAFFFSQVYMTIPPEDNKGLGPYQTVQTRVGKRVAPTVLTIDDALDYMYSVEEAFCDEPEKYDEFLNILVTAHRFGEAIVFAKVANLMKGHPNLLLGFRVYLSPQPKKITPPETETKPNNNKRKRGTTSVVNKPKTRSRSRARGN